MVSVPQLAKSLDITPQAVRQRMSHFDGFIYNHTKMIKHRRCIDDKGVKMIINSKSHRKRSDKYVDYNNGQGHLIDQLRTDLKYQRKSTDRLMDENKRLTFMVGNIQNRLDKTQQKLLNYHNKQKKHGWVYRLFH